MKSCLIILKMNLNNPKVTVIVTTYNRKKLLKETINSILNQTFTDFELIVVDNYSDYDFISFMESFQDSRISAFQNKNNGIIAINRNFGIKKAKGEYIAFCDDDDLWNKDKIGSYLKIFYSKTNIGLITSNEYLIDENSKRLNTKVSEITTDRIYNFKTLFFHNIVSSSSAVVRSEVIEKVGLFDESKEIRVVEDSHLWWRIAMHCDVYYKAKVLGSYRVHRKGISKNIDESKINLFNAVADIISNYPKQVKPFKKEAIKYLKRIAITNSWYFFKRRKIRRAFYWIKKALIIPAPKGFKKVTYVKK